MHFFKPATLATTLFLWGGAAIAVDTHRKREAVRTALSNYVDGISRGDYELALSCTSKPESDSPLEPTDLLLKRRRTLVNFYCSSQRLYIPWHRRFSLAPPNQVCGVSVYYIKQSDATVILKAIANADVRLEERAAYLTLKPGEAKRPEITPFVPTGVFRLAYSDGWKVDMNDSVAMVQPNSCDTESDVQIAQSSFDMVDRAADRMASVADTISKGSPLTAEQAALLLNDPPDTPTVERKPNSNARSPTTSP